MTDTPALATQPYRSPPDGHPKRMRIARIHYVFGLLLLCLSGYPSAVAFASLLDSPARLTFAVFLFAMALSFVATLVWAARTIRRRTPVSVAVKRASVELVYRDGSRATLPVDDLRVDLQGGHVRLWDDERIHTIEPGAFLSTEDAAAFTAELNALVGYDITKPADEIARLRREARREASL